MFFSWLGLAIVMIIIINLQKEFLFETYGRETIFYYIVLFAYGITIPLLLFFISKTVSILNTL